MPHALLEQFAPIVCGEELRLYPRAISKPMRYHEKRSLRCLENRTLVEADSSPLESLELPGPVIAASNDKSGV